MNKKRIPIWRESHANKIILQCQRAYEAGGIQDVINLADSHQAGYLYCGPCDAEMPVSKTPSRCECLVCGSPGVE